MLAANRDGQQLWFANMAGSRNGYTPHPRRDYRRAPDQIHRGLPTAAHRTEPAGASTDIRRDPDQLDLFTYDPVEAAARRHGFGDPPRIRFAGHLDRLVLDQAERHGWSEHQTRTTQITLRVLQARHHWTEGPIKTSHVHELASLGLTIRMALVVLDDNDLLIEDRTPPLHAWFARHTRGLPEPMGNELTTWFEVLHHGSTTPPRSRPRHATTIKTRTLWAMPTLRTWAEAGRQSLREITREDILEVLPAEGTPRVKLGSALRSIFTTLKQHRVVFLNPMARLSIGNHERRIPMPIDTDRIRVAFNSPDPTTAAITALIGVHGLRPREATALQLTDVRDHRIALPDRTVLLAPATKVRLDTYLNHRHQRWPGSINPHFLIHSRSATTLERVSVPWLTVKLGITASALRQDRILAEVHAGGDARRICDFFGVTITTAEHYTSTTNHPDLDEFTTPPTSPRTHAYSTAHHDEPTLGFLTRSPSDFLN